MSEQDREAREQRVRELVAGLSTVSPEPDFRARLRTGFSTGTLEEPAAGPARVIPLFWRWGGAVAAIAALFAGFFLANRGPVWEATGLTGEGSVRVGERVFAAAELEALGRNLRAGDTLAVEGGAQLDLVCAGTLAIQMAPGSEITIPNSPGRWVGRTIECHVEEGEVRFVTGSEFAGAELHLTAPSAHIEVFGTTFAVISAADSTCVCVLEGEVTINSAAVREGMRRTVFPETEEALEEEIYPMERMKLQMLQDQARSVLAEKR